MIIKLNDGETCTICMNHKENIDNTFYVFTRNGDHIAVRKFDKLG